MALQEQKYRHRSWLQFVGDLRAGIQKLLRDFDRRISDKPGLQRMQTSSQEWQSDWQPRDGPCYECYLNDSKQHPQGKHIV
jgi:hypothetical protein